MTSTYHWMVFGKTRIHQLTAMTFHSHSKENRPGPTQNLQRKMRPKEKEKSLQTCQNVNQQRMDPTTVQHKKPKQIREI
ncbi:hypothetical protein CDL12_03058 [Handroanthus impetiginosus]|uniref:Uncharacterized protein n=1 Tax=Handroanthus impetiginosus TaxID=429701 RepID=A0A2G9I394_9LAMI|nr:hypothetical protein CDL12_03058 [Handroanthus impetiginosus]